MTTKFQHIIGAASFSRIAGQVFREFLRVEKMLLITTASRSKSMVVNHGMPEEFRELFAGLILCQFIVTRFGYDFRDKRIRMFGSQIVPKFFQRVNYIIMVEIFSQPTVTFISCDSIQIVE